MTGKPEINVGVHTCSENHSKSVQTKQSVRVTSLYYFAKGIDMLTQSAIDNL
jgi:hypothetical protein